MVAGSSTYGDDAAFSSSRQDEESDIPPGWDYDPSSWSQRLPIVGAALIGFAIAGYLALFQWEVFASVWEPSLGTVAGRS